MIDYPCNSKREAEQVEDRYMQLLKPILNMRRAFQTSETRKEYFDKRKGIKKEYDKIRRTDKAEEIKAKKREAYLRDKEIGSQMIICICGSKIQYRFKRKHEKHKSI